MHESDLACSEQWPSSGAGNVGATAAQRLAEKNLARTVVMIDVVEGVPQGKGLDQWQSGPIEGFDTRVIGTNGYDEAAGADIVRRHRRHRAQAGHEPRRPGQDQRRHRAARSREQIARVAPKAIIIVVSNPLDVMCYVAMKATRLPARARDRHGRRARHRALPRRSSPRRWTSRCEDIQAMVLGGHGDTMVPLVSYTTVSGHSGHPAASPPDKLDAIVDRTRNGGAEIVAFLKTGSAYYAPSAAAVQMVEAIALDKRRILPCSAWLQGEYGLKDVFCGVPCKLGRNGLEQILEIKLTDAERAELVKSAEAVRATQAVVDAA